MDLSTSGIVAIQAFVTDWTPTNNAILAALNAPSIANPTPQDSIAVPFVTATLMGALDATALGKMQNLPSLARLLDDITARVPGPLNNWIVLLEAGGTITSSQATSLGVIVNATQPDPSWPAQISWAQANLGRPVDLSDIAAARPGV